MRALLEAGGVLRLHTTGTLRPYTVGEHCYRALTILFHLYPGEPSLALVRSLLWHDAAERFLGDLPSPAKRRFPILAVAYEAAERQVLAQMGLREALSPDEARWLRAVDALELFLWAEEQVVGLGDRRVRSVRDNVRRYLLSDPDTPAEVRDYTISYQWGRDNDELP